MTHITIIIPARNQKAYIENTIDSIGKNCSTSFKLTIIIVNDASTDNTLILATLALKKYNWSTIIIDNPKALGAGAARNKAIEHIPECDYVLFFDSDDFMPKGSLKTLLNTAMLSGSDLIIGTHRFLDDEGLSNMYLSDQVAWTTLLKSKISVDVSAEDVWKLCKIANYPWNKLIKYQYLKEIDLIFSETAVHNDIYAHWQLVVPCKKITLVNSNICYHRMNNRGEKITNIADERRLEVISVLADVYECLSQQYHLDPVDNRMLAFSEFHLELIKWCLDTISLEYREQLLSGYKVFLSVYGRKDFDAMYDFSPNVALELGEFKFGINELQYEEKGRATNHLKVIIKWFLNYKVFYSCYLLWVDRSHSSLLPNNFLKRKEIIVQKYNA